MTPGKKRQAELRQRRTRADERQVTVWLDQESRTRVAALRQPGERASAVMRRALQALAAEHNRTIEAEIRDLEARHLALHEIVRAMYYESGLTPRQIARLMNTVSEPLAPGDRWTEDTVAAYLVRNAVVSDWSVFGLKPVP
jgi:hypothetical protein